MEDIVHALMMAFSMFVFVVALSVVMYMFNQATSTADAIIYYADETNYYDNIEIDEGQTKRQVDVDTVILTLYRYYKENFCVKIYGAPTATEPTGELLQVFDLNIEAGVRQSASTVESIKTKKQKSLNILYNDSSKAAYMFGVPWLGSAERDSSVKARIDYYINGSSGYINNTYVNYRHNKFYKIKEYNKTASEENKVYFTEEFIRYTYSGDTLVTEQGDILVEGAMPEDKIVVIYTATR